MNKNLQKLASIGNKAARIGIGLMSGTSLDGLDIALCRFTGAGLDTHFELLNFTTIQYQPAFKDEVRSIFSKRQVDLEKLCLLNAYIGSYHGRLVNKALEAWQFKVSDVDFIASHGQTIYHAPQRLHKSQCYPNATLQIGDGDHLAVTTGIVTISDFRQKHIAAGGEGAPLALYGDVILGSKSGENQVLLNIGGIANLTWLPGDMRSNIMCTDVGPGNTLVDAACKQLFGKDFDEDGKIAFAGTVHEALLRELCNDGYFSEAAPKTTGPELFNLEYVQQAKQRAGANDISATDLISTLAAFTAQTIAAFIKVNVSIEGLKIFASGGGARNPYILQALQQLLPGAYIGNTGELGINADAKEAILFALLGNEALVGEPLSIGTNPAVLMGKFSFPA